MRPGFALKAPHPRVKNVRVSRIDIEICDAVLIVDVERLRPCLAAVRRHKHAAFFIWTESVPQCADVNDVVVLRIDSDGGDALSVFKAHVLPRFPTVSGLINTVAERNT